MLTGTEKLLCQKDGTYDSPANETYCKKGNSSKHFFKKKNKLFDKN